MVFKVVKKLKKEILKLKEHLSWNNIPDAELIKEINLSDSGGCRLFVEDLNQDGIKEFLWLQSAGMFKSKIYDKFSNVKNYLDKVKQSSVFCLTATDQEGRIIWQSGKPYYGESPYLTHAPEQLLKMGDVDGDGINEILVFDAYDNLLVINPINGKTKRTIKLPEDNFSIVYYVKLSSAPKDFVLLIGVMDRAYDPHPYANPWIIMDSEFQIISCRDYKGAGHNVIIEDFNNDGEIEFLIGYQLVNTKGEVLWTVDYWDKREINSLEQHADNIQAHKVDDEWFVTISGSDKQYYVNSKGKTIWVETLPHPQFSLIGNYNGEDRIFVANQREGMNSYTLEGKEAWNGLLPEHWPLGKPISINSERPIHINDPMNLIPSKDNDLMLYKEGGWPYVIDFSGKIVYKLPMPQTAKKSDPKVYYRRINDIGFSFEGEVADIDNDGNYEILVYDRNYLWVYKLLNGK